MKRKMYTKTHNIDLLKQIDNDGRQFTAEEHTFAIEQEFGDKFISKDSLLAWYLSWDASCLYPLSFLVHHIYKYQFKNIISLGAGPCILEYMLKEALPSNYNVVATDYNEFFIKKAKLLFPQIIPINFDFFLDDLTKIKNNIDFDLDIAVFIGSAYVMDDAQFINLFKKLKEAGIKQIIDFHAGYMDLQSVLKTYIREVLPLRKNSFLRKILKKLPLSNYAGKFHGFSRSRNELRRIYKKAGVKVVKETSIMPCKYVAICN